MPKGVKHGGRRLAPEQPEQARYGNSSNLQHGLLSAKPPAAAELPVRLKVTKLDDYAGTIAASLLKLAECIQDDMPVHATQDEQQLPSKFLYAAANMLQLESSIRGKGIKPAPYGALSMKSYRESSKNFNRMLWLMLARLVNASRFFGEKGVLDINGKLRTGLNGYVQEATRAATVIRLWAAGHAWALERKRELDNDGDMMRRIDALVNEGDKPSPTET